MMPDIYQNQKTTVLVFDLLLSMQGAKVNVPHPDHIRTTHGESVFSTGPPMISSVLIVLTRRNAEEAGTMST
jgi:hypothetical protein